MARTTQRCGRHNERWLNNPERRIGQQQMLRAILTGMSADDPLYHEYRAQLDSRHPGTRSRST